MNKFLTIEQLSKVRSLNKTARIVHCHGVFDLFHYGHLLHLRAAKAYGDVLVVSVTSDEFVNKGPSRPRFSAVKRAEILSSLELVDYVVINPFPTGIEVILALKPTFYVKGPDYRNFSDDTSGAISQEERAVRSVGGQLVITEEETESSTELINDFFSVWTNEQAQIRSAVKRKISSDFLNNLFERIKKLNVLVVGEPIIDTYVYCEPENLSSKSPSISSCYKYEESYAGGSYAVARHLDALGCIVTLIAPRGQEKNVEEIETSIISETRINLHSVVEGQLSTPEKIRYVSHKSNQRMFELTRLDAIGWRAAPLKRFQELFVEQARLSDLVLVLDFGHGLWEGERLNLLQMIKTFRAVNVQTNSSNQGFNLYHKHREFDYLVLDERELRLARCDRYSKISELIDSTRVMISDKAFSVTTGASGSIYVAPGGDKYESPAFSQRPLDTTGAGDAFFAITAILTYLKIEPSLIPFLGNIFAGLKTGIIGNKRPVSKVDFQRAVRALLG